jgi:hypothetical protein
MAHSGGKRESLEFEFMVLEFSGSVDLQKAVGSSHLWVGGKLCEVPRYYESSDATRCTNCQLYGHPPALCREESHTRPILTQEPEDLTRCPTLGIRD